MSKIKKKTKKNNSLNLQNKIIKNLSNRLHNFRLRLILILNLQANGQKPKGDN